MLRAENQYQKTSFNTDLTQELFYQLKQLKLERIKIQRKAWFLFVGTLLWTWKTCWI